MMQLMPEPIPNMPMIGALLAVTDLMTLDELKERAGWVVRLASITGLTITGNDFQGLDVSVTDSVDVTFSGAAYDEYARPCKRWRDSALEWLVENFPDDPNAEFFRKTLEELSRPGLRLVGDARDQGRNEDVLQHGQLGEQMVLLKDESNVLVAKVRQLALAQ